MKEEIVKINVSDIDETQRRRTIQEKYNEEHNIIPKTIKKEIEKLYLITKK